MWIEAEFFYIPCYALLKLDKMAWSKIRKRQEGMCRIEFGWWYYKIKCEIGYHLFGSTSKIYNKNLDKMLSKYNRNLYGQNMHEV